jgi:hypothetical protein
MADTTVLIREDSGRTFEKYYQLAPGEHERMTKEFVAYKNKDTDCRRAALYKDTAGNSVTFDFEYVVLIKI